MDLVVVILFIVVMVVAFNYWKRKEIKAMSPQELEKYRAAKKDRAAKKGTNDFLLTLKWGEKNPALVCPHCQEKGEIRIRRVKRKRGISGGKATAAVLTAGFSMLATGLSRKEKLTEAHCGNCGSTWCF